jgi:hypothetical protein
MPETVRKTRVYPLDCTSAFCGKGPESCPACRFYPKLKDFKDWVSMTGAVCEDPIWCPLVYTARVLVPSPSTPNGPVRTPEARASAKPIRADYYQADLFGGESAT